MDIERIVYIDITGVAKRVKLSWKDNFAHLLDICLKYEIIGRVLVEDNDAILITPLISLDQDDPDVIPFIIPKDIIIKRQKLYAKKKD